jgi:lysophospholipase L1-like esterase
VGTSHEQFVLNRRVAIVLSLWLLGTLCAAALLVGTGRGQGWLRRAGITPSRMWMPSYGRAISEHAAMNATLSPGCVLLGGDSLTALFPAELLTPRRWVNRGISGDRVADLEARLDPSVLSSPCETIAILIGSNDIVIDERSAEHVERGVAAIVERLHEEGRRVLLATLPPTRDRFAHAQRAIEETNEGLRARSQILGVEILAMHDAFAGEDGLLEPRYSADGLHLTSEGYRVWTSVLEAELQSEPNPSLR